ncbi:MAG: PadR family transcriptional regulator [Actinomycetota bacterium]|jgi:DNA-binding PadR family transcriptional regulator|nr:PadR family transcriptional regulator [Euzebyales bacterium]MDQ3030711.1 PadR family transcriptional regulator [Actinomycetota bacterium]MDQ3342126.1 PadR family transcriptional regulator [Actinomycetota bacterium]MDQ3528457.1 PadR family transcriptional regulator [Actinomycetota bacterium]
MLELAILGLLKERAMHGYELRKQLAHKLGFFWTVSYGALYPALRKLEKRGAVEKFFPAEQTTRRKQVYRITAGGEAEFLELLTEGAHSTWEEDKFPLRLAFFRYLKPETRLRLLERRKAYLEDKLDEGRRSLTQAKRGSTDSYTLSLVRHGMETTEHDISWLDTLISAERVALGDPPITPAPAAPQDVDGDHPTTLQTSTELQRK